MKKKVEMSNLLATEVDFTFTQKQSPKNSKKKGKKLKIEMSNAINLKKTWFAF